MYVILKTSPSMFKQSVDSITYTIIIILVPGYITFQRQMVSFYSLQFTLTLFWTSNLADFLYTD